MKWTAFFLAIIIISLNSFSNDSFYSYEDEEYVDLFMKRLGMYGVGAGYTFGFVPHKNLKSYSSKGGYFAQLSISGTCLALTYHRDYMELNTDIADSYNIKDPSATFGRLTFAFNIPVYRLHNEIVAFSPTINYGLGGYRFVLNEEAMNKLGGTNLTKIHNKDLKFGQLFGVGLTTTFWERININFTWNVNWVVRDYKWWYLITSSLVPLFTEDTDNFTKFMVGVSFMFGKTL